MSTQIQALSNQKTMSSNALVDLINEIRKQENPGTATLAHSDLLKKIQKVLGVNAGKFSGVYFDAKNESRPCYNLPKREATLMVMSESYKVQAAVYDRMTELENAQPAFKLPDFTDPYESALAWAKEFKHKQSALLIVEAQHKKIEQQQKAIEAKDDMIRASNEASVKAGEILIREFVKSIDLVDVGEKKFYQWMREQKIIFSDHNEPYQQYVSSGYFTYRPSAVPVNGAVRYQIRVTPRGKIWLAARYMAYVDSLAFSVLDNPARNGLVIIQGSVL